MPLHERLNLVKGVETVWGKIIPEKEAYLYSTRQIAAFSANIFQVMRILEPDYAKRTAAICSAAYAVSITSAQNPESQAGYVKNFRDEWNIPEFCEQGAWLGGLIGDSGDEYQNMSGRVIQFTPDRVEKELDTCPWDIVGAEMCNMTTATFMANFDLNSPYGEPNEIALNMCEARGCGDMHCRVVAERRSVYGHAVQGPLDHFNQPADPVTSTPREKMFREGQVLRNGKYTNVFGEEQNLEWCYHWTQVNGWTWSIAFPLMAIRNMASSEEEFRRIVKIVFSTAGKAAFIEPFAVKGLRDWLGVPYEIDVDDGRIMGGYIKANLDTQLLSNELVRFDEEETRIKVKVSDFQSRFEYLPIPELVIGYEALWHNMVKTMVSAEWSCWFEDKDKEYMTIVVARKIDKKMH
jgi:hypothetical protein